MALADRIVANICENENFANDLDALLSFHAARAIGITPARLPTEDVVCRLLQTATNLALTQSVVNRALSYRIVTAALSLREYFEGIAGIASLVLSRIGNFPGLQFLESRGGTGFETFPMRLQVEQYHRRDVNTVEPIPGHRRIFTDFQREIWKSLSLGATMSVSAPTSAGKSFVLQSFIESVLRRSAGEAFQAVYLAPTRALLSQIALGFLERLRADGIDDVAIITAPLDKESAVPNRAFYVMTQERLNVFMANFPSVQFDFLVVDEAQQIQDGARGVLLSTVIDEVLARSPLIQAFFAMPNVANPEVFGSHFGIKGLLAMRSRESPVSQNIFMLKRERRSRRKFGVRLRLQQDGGERQVGYIETSASCESDVDFLAQIALAVGQGESNLIYANSGGPCEMVTAQIAGGLPLLEPSRELESLSALIAEEIHPEHVLIQSIPSGVGCHYGSMPPLARQAIEESFVSRRLNFLATTSTLLFGVNLPAHNIFVHKPRKGMDTPIGSVDFWNLVGRAGRLGKELDGNVFLIDYDDWDSKPLSGDEEDTVIPAITRALLERSQDILQFINSPLVQNNPYSAEVENIVAKLYKDYDRGVLDNVLVRAGVSEAIQSSIRVALGELAKRITLPAAELNANPTVSAIRQQRLFDALLSHAEHRRLRAFFPVHPMAPNSFEILSSCFKLAQECLETQERTNNLYRYHAYLSQVWMEGESIPSIIDRSFKYKSDRGESPKKNTLIRAVLSDIEGPVKFTYVRLMSCYVNLLRLALHKIGRDDLQDRLPALPTFLELGACDPTTLNLIGIGLSRSTARRLKGLVGLALQTPDDARAWIGRLNLASLDLSELVRREIMVVATGVK